MLEGDPRQAMQSDCNAKPNKAYDDQDRVEKQRVPHPPKHVIVHEEQQQEPERLRDVLQEILFMFLDCVLILDVHVFGELLLYCKVVAIAQDDIV